jgi:aminoglycoside 6'-N-acetyltransferase I
VGPRDSVEIEPAGLPDAAAVAELATRFFVEESFGLPAGGLESRVRRYLDADGHAIFVARRAGRLIGFATVTTGYGLEYGWSAELEDLYILPSERRRGIARRLVERVANWAAGRGCSAVLVTVTPEGEEAHSLVAFYARLSFEDRGRRILELPLS